MMNNIELSLAGRYEITTQHRFAGVSRDVVDRKR